MAPMGRESPLSLVTAIVTHNYIVEHNIAKKEIDPRTMMRFMTKHVGPYDFCGGPVANPVIGWLSRSDYLANKFDRATFYMSRKCSIYADFAFNSRQSREVLAIKVTDINQETLKDARIPYKAIVEKLTNSYPKKGHTKIESTSDAIILDSDVSFGGKRRHMVCLFPLSPLIEIPT
jgi:hypothetical protein